MYVVTAENTQQYNKIYLKPYYRESMIANTNYEYSLTLNPQDKISNVVNAIINFQVYISPTITYTLFVNDKSCNNPTFFVSTTYANAGLGLVSFDCSNVIKEKGIYNIKFKSSKNTGSIFGWLDLTYSSDIKGDLKVYGTEYIIGQQAKLWLQLRDTNGTAIQTGICYVDVYTPDNNELIEQATMNNFYHDGIYYYDLDTTTLNEGVYPVIARCYYVASQTPNYATSFLVINGSVDSGVLTDTYVQDTNYLLTSETTSVGGNPRRYDFEFYLNNQSCMFPESLMNGITIKWVGKWNSIAADDMFIHIFNYTSNTWILLPNYIEGSGSGVKIVSNSLSVNNLSASGLTNSSYQGIRIKFNDTINADGTTTGFDYDYLSVLCDAYSIPIWQSVSGSSEMHLNQNLNLNIDESLNNIEGENMATGYIILFIFNCVAFLFNMVKFKKPAFQLLIGFLFLGLTGMFSSVQLNVVATINMVLFVVSVITWIVLVKENRSNLSDGNI